MLVVARWLDDGRPADGAVALPIAGTAADLDLAEGREGLLHLMAALGDLEGRGVLTVAWPQGVGAGEARVTLSGDLRRDARRRFGGG